MVRVSSRKKTITKQAASQTEMVPAIMLQQDVLNLICEKLSVVDLLLCSMVCRGFMRTIDANMTTFFNKSLRWWSVFDACCGDGPVVTYNAQRQQYEQTQVVHDRWQHRWLFHVVPQVGAIVHMRMHLQLALEHVLLTGTDEHVRVIRNNGVASVDALEWEILEVTKGEEASSICRGTKSRIRMQVLGYVHNNRKVSLRMLQSIVVTFENVPVLHWPVPHRVLCVIKCNSKCMHCHQRVSKWQSVDVVMPEHRVLCSVCMEELFVNEQRLKTKWKINVRFPADDSLVRRCFFVQSWNFNHISNLKWEKNNVFMLKSDVAQALGHATWTKLLQFNRSHSSTGKRSEKRFANFSFSTRWFL
jgi:hypothetical protein